MQKTPGGLTSFPIVQASLDLLSSKQRTATLFLTYCWDPIAVGALYGLGVTRNGSHSLGGSCALCLTLLLTSS